MTQDERAKAIEAWRNKAKCHINPPSMLTNAVIEDGLALMRSADADLAEMRGRYELLKRAVNESASECKPKCDSVAHEEDCPVVNAAQWLVDARRERDEALRELAEMRGRVEALTAAAKAVINRGTERWNDGEVEMLRVEMDSGTWDALRAALQPTSDVAAVEPLSPDEVSTARSYMDDNVLANMRNDANAMIVMKQFGEDLTDARLRLVTAVVNDLVRRELARSQREREGGR
jgi:hypothetical protein